MLRKQSSTDRTEKKALALEDPVALRQRHLRRTREERTTAETNRTLLYASILLFHEGMVAEYLATLLSLD